MAAVLPANELFRLDSAERAPRLDVLSLWIRPYMNVATAAFYLEVTGRADMMPKPEA